MSRNFVQPPRAAVAEFQRGSKCPTEVVKRGETLQCEKLRVTLFFDRAKIGKCVADEAAGLFKEVGLIGGEFAGAAIQITSTTPACRLSPGQAGDQRGFHAWAAGLVEMLEAVFRDLFSAHQRLPPDS